MQIALMSHPSSNNISYTALTDEENQYAPTKPKIGFAFHLRSGPALWGSVIVLQTFIILTLLWRSNLTRTVDVPYLYCECSNITQNVDLEVFTDFPLSSSRGRRRAI
jgi:hypothetical protein